MAGYTLTWRDGSRSQSELGQVPGPVDGSWVRPDTLGRLERSALAGHKVAVGRERVAFGELFEISGEPGDRLMLRDAPPLDQLGAEMASGELVVHGPVGDDLGASMRGGRIVVHGSAGDRVGGPVHSSARGMRGGEIVVHGDVGALGGYRMRRGTIAIAGEAAGLVGYRMIAGTIAVVGGVIGESSGGDGVDTDQSPGIGMKRGTIVCLDADGEDRAVPLDHGFSRVGRFDGREMVAWRLVLRRLMALGIAAAQEAMDDAIEVYSGDALALNRGEIWQRVCRV